MKNLSQSQLDTQYYRHTKFYVDHYMLRKLINKNTYYAVALKRLPEYGCCSLKGFRAMNSIIMTNQIIAVDKRIGTIRATLGL